MLNRTIFKTTVNAQDEKDPERTIEYTFYINQMPAMKLERWLFRAGKLLVGAGILEAFGNSQELFSQLAASIKDDSALTSFARQLGGLDDDAALKLLEEMTACAELCLNGNMYKLDEQTINAHLDLPALVRVQAECFKTNFGFFTAGKLLSSPESLPQSSDGSATNSRKPRISVRSSVKS